MSLAQGNGNSGNTPADTNANSQGSLRWKLNGNQIQGTEFMGTTNQKDLIFKSGGIEGLRITPANEMKIPGQVYMELYKPLPGLDDNFLTIDYNGQVKSVEKSGLVNAIYAEPCKETLLINGTTTYTPTWASEVGVLWTGDACAPAKVGINTSSPTATLQVQGSTFLTGNVGIHTSPSGNSSLIVKQANPTLTALTVEFTPNSTNYSGVGLNVKVNDNNRKAITITNTQNNNDVFRVMGNGLIYATEMKIRLSSNFPDYVFTDEYKLMPLLKLDEFISKNGHLPKIPDANTVKEEGLPVGEIEILLVEKVEELTLYLIELKKENEKLIKELEELKLKFSCK